MIEIHDHEFQLLRDYLLHLSGIGVPSEKRYLFETRLREFIMNEKCGSFAEFYRKLTSGENGRHLQEQFIQAMTTHESGFFRDVHPYEILQQKFLPETAALRKKESIFLPPRLRILSAGCSMGQEPYSIAMCVMEWLCMQTAYAAEDVTILGIDISKSILKRAREGRYSDFEFGNHAPSTYRDKYCRRSGEHWIVKERIRKMVSFAEVNLAQDFGKVGRFDIIFCRNVIIYFPIKVKKAILAQFHRLLNRGGVLIMGASESLYQLSDKYDAHSKGNTNYYTPIK